MRMSNVLFLALVVFFVGGGGIYQYRRADAAPSHPVTAYDADVDHDGHVTILDIADVAQYFFQDVPLATATVPLTTYVVSGTLATPPVNCAGLTKCTVSAYCDTGDAVTGGGVNHETGYSLVFSAPVEGGWAGQWVNADDGEMAWAVCLDNPPLHAATEISTTTPAPSLTSTPPGTPGVPPTNTSVPTASPIATETAEVSQTPEVTKTIDVTRTVEVTKTPEVTRTIEVIVTPVASTTPDLTATPTP